MSSLYKIETKLVGSSPQGTRVSEELALLPHSFTALRCNTLLPMKKPALKVVMGRDAVGLVPYPLDRGTSWTKEVMDAAGNEFEKNVMEKCNFYLESVGIDPQQTVEPQSLLKDKFNSLLSSKMVDVLSKQFMRQLEGIFGMYLALSRVVDEAQFAGIMLVYAQTHTNRSLTAIISEYAADLFSTNIEAQSGESEDEAVPPLIDGKFDTSQYGDERVVEEMEKKKETLSRTLAKERDVVTEKPKWLESMKLGLENWKLIIHNPGFDKVSRVLSLLVTMGFFGGDLDFNIGNLTLFSIGAQQKQVGAVDLIDAIFETIAYFGEGAFNCFREGSLKPLIFSSSDMSKMENQYIKMLELWEYARNGNLRKFAEIEEAEFDKALSDLVDSFEYLYKTVPNGTERKIYSDRWRELSKIKSEFNATRIRGGLRVAPWTFKMYGQSGVGKTTVSDIFLVSTLKANGYPGDDDHIITIDNNDHHMSNARTYITGYKLDDVANSKLDQTDINPSEWLIMICNNVRRYAIMADLANKGKISIEPACVAITTNVESMAAELTSNEPLSVVRRAHQHWILEVRPEYRKKDDLGNVTTMLDSKKVVKEWGANPLPDVWLLTHRVVVIDPTPKGQPQNYHFEDNPDMTRVSIHEALEFNLKHAAEHFAEQRVIVKTNTNVVEKIDWCATHNRPSQTCGCYKGAQYVDTVIDEEREAKRAKNETEKKAVGPQIGFRMANTLLNYSSHWEKKYVPKVMAVTATVEQMACKSVITALKEFEESPYSRWTSYVPESWLDNRYVKSLALLTGINEVRHKVKRKVLKLNLSCAPIFWGLWKVYPKAAAGCFLGLQLMTLFGYGCAVEHAKAEYMNELRRRRDLMPEAFKMARESYLKYACGAFAGFAVAYGAYKTYKALRCAMDVRVQGSLSPTDGEAIKLRDLEANPWKVEEPCDPGVTARVGKTDDWDSLMQNAVKNITYKHDAQVDKTSHAFIVGSNVVLVPSHFLPAEPVLATISGKTTGGHLWNRQFILNREACQLIPQTDLALVYAPSVGVAKDMRKFFLKDCERRAINARLYHLKDMFSHPENVPLRWVYEPDVTNNYKINGEKCVFPGSWYHLPMQTYGGLCMAPIVADTKHSGILGFHLGGNEGGTFGCAGFLSQRALETGLTALRNKSKCNAVIMQSADIPTSTYGVEYKVSDDIHYKSPTRYIDDDAQVEVYGTVKGRAAATSKVEDTEISQTVTAVTGLENKWGPPQFDGPVEFWKGTAKARWHCWQASLAVCSKPSAGFDPIKVDQAAEDYLKGLRVCFEAQKGTWKEQLKPLTDVEVVSGRDGQRFIDGMVKKTSMGYPIGGPKSHWIDALDPEDYDNMSSPRTFKPPVWEEVARLRKLALEGKCLNTIYTASLKDEPTKRTKTKVRVFQAAPVALQILLRKYFLPVARFLSMNPLVAECAVGINAHGREWEELSNHMKKYGSDRIVAGDYSKYDLRMPAQLTIAAFQMMIDIAKWSENYTEEDFTIMQALVTDVCYPLVAFNGDLVRFIGTNPSGQNLTVYLNSLVNSLLHRLGFYDVYPESTDFRKAMALGTYGDDSKGSVAEEYTHFNAISFSEFLRRHDIVYTDPEKKGITTPFMTDSSASFLKRTNVFRPELNAWVGMIEEDSIAKSLHAIKRSHDLTNREICTQNVEGALREWFFHGEEVYERRRAQMQEVARIHNLPSRGLNQDYEYRCKDWLAKHGVGPQSGTKKKKIDLDDLVDMEEFEPKDSTQLSSLSFSCSPTDEALLQDECIEVTPLTKIAQEYIIGSSSLGKGDLIFQTTILAEYSIFLVVETKSIMGKRSKPMVKAKEQARKYAQVVSILRPDAVVLALVYTELGYDFVHRYGPWRKIPREIVQLWC
nr:hypothetical protein 1 [Mute swan feces associated picorna-like virus 27]